MLNNGFNYISKIKEFLESCNPYFNFNDYFKIVINEEIPPSIVDFVTSCCNVPVHSSTSNFVADFLKSPVLVIVLNYSPSQLEELRKKYGHVWFEFLELNPNPSKYKNVYNINS